MQTRATEGEGNAKDNAKQSALNNKAKGITDWETGRRAGQGGLQVVKSEGHCSERGGAKSRVRQDWRQGRAVWNNHKGSADCVTQKPGSEEGIAEINANLK